MGIQICTGPAGPLQYETLSGLVDSAPGPVWTVVPNEIDATQLLKRMLGERGMVTGLTVGTFIRLSRELAPAAAAREIPRSLQEMLMYRVLVGLDTRFRYEWPDFAATAVRVVEHLRSGGADHQQQELSRMQPRESRFWKQVSRRWDTYLDEAGFSDDAVIMEAAATAAESHAKTSTFVVYGFDELTDHQHTLLSSLARHNTVHVVTPYEPGRTVMYHRESMIAALEQVTGASVRHSDSDGTGSPGGLARCLWEPTAAWAGAGISYVEAADDLAQARAVIAAIRKLMEDGADPGSIACLSVNPHRTRSLLETVARDAGMPLHIETSRLLVQTPYGRRLQAVLESLPASDDRLASVRNHLAGIQPQTRGELRILSAVDREIDNLAGLAGSSRSVSADDISRVLGSMMIPADPHRAGDRPTVTAINQVTTSRFAHVILFDLHEGGFTTPAPVEGLADAVLEEHRARDLIYRAVTTAEKTVTFIRSTCDERGETRAPHGTWYEIARHLDTRPAHRYGFTQQVPSPAAVRTRRERARVAVRHGMDIGLPGRRYGEGIDDTFPEPMVKTVSASAIQHYLECPSQWLVGDYLLKSISETTAPMVIGSLFHGIFETLHREGKRSITPQQVHRMVLERVAALDADEQALVTTSDIELIVTHLTDVFNSTPPFVGSHIAAETRIEQGHAQVGGVDFVGTIDRIDFDPATGQAFLHDYKSSPIGSAFTSWAKNGYVQLGLYWLAIEGTSLAATGEQPLTVTGVSYIPVIKRKGEQPRALVAGDAIDTDMVEGSTAKDAETVREILDDIQERADTAVQGMCQGAVPAVEHQKGRQTCYEVCDFAGACRIRETREYAR